MSSTRDCPQCGREAGFHTPACAGAAPRVEPDKLDEMRKTLEALYCDAVTWGAEKLSPWSLQLVQDIGKALGTARWLALDVERRRLDAAALSPPLTLAEAQAQLRGKGAL